MDHPFFEKVSIAFIQIIPIIIIWVRIESRLATLEGRFGMYMQLLERLLSHTNDRRGS